MIVLDGFLALAKWPTPSGKLEIQYTPLLAHHTIRGTMNFGLPFIWIFFATQRTVAAVIVIAVDGNSQLTKTKLLPISGTARKVSFHEIWRGNPSMGKKFFLIFHSQRSLDGYSLLTSLLSL